MATRIAGITVEIGGDTTKLSTALKSVNTQIKSTQTQLRDVNKLLKLDPTNTTLLTQKQKLLTEAIADTKEKLNTLEVAAEQANEELQNGEITQEQYDALQREIVDTKQKLKSLADQAAESNATLVKIEEAGKSLESVGDSISGVGTKMLGLTGVVAAAGTAAISTTSDFETAMSKVESLISSSSQDLTSDMEILEAKAREAGETTKFSATEAAEAMSYMGLAGWSATEMVDGLDGILNLAAASEMDLATASDIVTDYLSAFGLTASDSTMLVDKMAYAMSNSNTSTEQLGEAYKNCAATATQLGYGLDETTAALMVMADAGIKGGEAGTALSSIMTRLGNNTSGCRDMLEAYGIEVYDEQGNVNSLSNILTGMQGVWANLTDEEKSNLAYVVAGKTAQSELMTVLGESTGSFEAYTEGLANCSGTAENMAAIMQDNLSGQLTILKSQLQELAISFGEVLMPAIKSIVSWFQNVVAKLNSMDDGTRQMIITIGLIVAAIGPLLVVIGKVISTVGKTMQSFSKLGKSILKVVNHVKTGTGTISKFISALGGISAPVVAVVAVVGTLAAAFVTLWNTNEDFRSSIINIWNQITSKVSNFISQLKTRFSDLGNKLSGLGVIVDALKAIWIEFCNILAPVFEGAFSLIETILSTVLDAIIGILDVFIGIFTGDWSQAWNGVKKIFSSIWEGIKGIISTVLNTIYSIVTTIWNSIYSFFSTILNSIKSVFSSIWNAIKTAISNVLSGIKTNVSNVWNSIKTTISTLMNSIKTVFTTVWNAIKTAISTVLTGIKTNVSNIWTSIKTTISTLMNGIKSVFTTVWNSIKTSISTVLTSIKTTVSSVWSSIKSSMSSVMSSIKTSTLNVWTNMKSGISTRISSIYSTIKSGFNSAVSYIKGLASSASGWGKDIINGIVSGIKSCISKVKSACNSVASAIKSILHFSVPDEGPLSDADEYMPDFMELLSGGIEDNEDGLIGKVKNMASSINSALSDNLNMPDLNSSLALAGGTSNGSSHSSASTTNNLGGITISVNGYNATDDKALAKTIANEINNMITEENNAFK